MSLLPIRDFANYLAKQYQCQRILSNAPEMLRPSSRPFDRSLHLSYLEIQVQLPDGVSIAADVLRSAVIVIDGAPPDHDLDAAALALSGWMDHAPVGLLSVSVESWTPDSLKDRLVEADLRVAFSGLASSRGGGPRDRVLAVIANNTSPQIEPAPDDFRVVAIMRAYNEADIIEQSVRHAAAQGLEVYIIDNWSDDGTYEIAEALQGQGVIGLERYPPDGCTETFDHKRLLQRIETVSSTLDASWCIHYDMDELRESPWPGVTLRDAIYHVDRSGYNSINHVMINFYPSNTDYSPEKDVTAHFRHYALRGGSGFLTKITGWKQTGQHIQLVPTGGHRVLFSGQRVYPYRFLIRHYPLRTSEQARAKITRRRYHVPKLARLLGWHTQYDKYDLTNAQLFENLCEWAQRELTEFDPATFYEENLIERLSGVGYEVSRQRYLSHVPEPLKPPLRKIRHLLRRLI